MQKLKILPKFFASYNSAGYRIKKARMKKEPDRLFHAIMEDFMASLEI